MIIKLRDYYYWYPEDATIEVSDEVAESLLADKKYEETYRRSMRRNKTYSLETECDMESTDFADIYDDPAVLLELKEQVCSLCRALNSLADVQGRRIEAHFLLGMSRKELALAEGVSESSLNESIARGLAEMKIFLENAQIHPVKCLQSVPYSGGG